MLSEPDARILRGVSPTRMCQGRCPCACPPCATDAARPARPSAARHARPYARHRGCGRLRPSCDVSRRGRRSVDSARRLPGIRTQRKIRMRTDSHKTARYSHTSTRGPGNDRVGYTAHDNGTTHSYDDREMRSRNLRCNSPRRKQGIRTLRQLFFLYGILARGVMTPEIVAVASARDARARAARNKSMAAAPAR